MKRFITNRFVTIEPPIAGPLEDTDAGRLQLAVERMACSMLDRLLEKADEAYSGWDDPSWGMYRRLLDDLFDDALSARTAFTYGLRLAEPHFLPEPELLVDIANRAMMLHRLTVIELLQREGIVAEDATPAP